VNDQAVALLEMLVAEIRGLREDMNRPGRRLAAPDRAALAGLLPILAAAVADRAFTVRELRDHAALPNQLVLLAAIDAAGGPNKLGRL
jgi:hypothetical protein